MIEPSYRTLEDVLGDPHFPATDAALRAGRHIDAAEADACAFLTDAQALLEPFYRRYGCDLVRSPNGYFYLLPSDGGLIPRRVISAGAMLVGQALTLLFLDPATVESSGVVSRTQVMELLASLVGEDRLLDCLNARLRRRNAAMEHGRVRLELDRGLRALEALGFVDLLDEDRVRLRSPLLRFADPVRGLEHETEALRRLAARGEVELREGDDEEEGEDEA